MSYDPYTGQYVSGSSDKYYDNEVQPQPESHEHWDNIADNSYLGQQEFDYTNDISEMQRSDFDAPNYEEEFGKNSREDAYSDFGYSKSATSNDGENPPTYGLGSGGYPSFQRRGTEKSRAMSSKMKKPSVEIVPVPVHEHAEQSLGRNGFERGEFTPVVEKK